MPPEETNSNGAKTGLSLSLTKDALERITKNLSNTLWMGIITGFAGITGYTLNLSSGGWKILFLFILLASASYISGFFLGFLFGIPKRNNDKESAYNLSTNLVDISDWLTKIIIGLGLIEIKRIPGHLESIGVYIQTSVNGENSLKIFSICSIVYFSVFGLYYGYNYMRLFLSGQYKGADDNLLNNEVMLIEKGEELNKQNLAPTTEIDQSTQKSLADYDQLLKNTKTEANYSFDDWYYKGVGAYNNKEYEKMIVYMQKALEKDPRSSFAPDAWLYLGLAYGNLKLYNKAIEANNKIVNEYKDYVYNYLPHYNNGIFYSALGLLDKSLEEYDMAIKKNPGYALSWNNKGDTLINLRREDEAMDAFEKALGIDPNLPYAWFNKAYVYSLRKDKDNMILSLKRAIELDPGYKITAKTNIAFKEYWEDDDFKTLLG